MAQWVLVFTPPEVRPFDIARLLCEKSAIHVSLSADRDVVDVEHKGERVEVVQDDAGSVIAEYEPSELSAVLAAIPHPNVFRVSYYRGNTLLSDVLHVVLALNEQSFIDNDYGVTATLEVALAQGLPRFLASRGGRFLHQGG
jgi:hypothetical protein